MCNRSCTFGLPESSRDQPGPHLPLHPNKDGAEHKGWRRNNYTEELLQEGLLWSRIIQGSITLISRFWLEEVLVVDLGWALMEKPGEQEVCTGSSCSGSFSVLPEDVLSEGSEFNLLLLSSRLCGQTKCSAVAVAQKPLFKSSGVTMSHHSSCQWLQVHKLLIAVVKPILCFVPGTPGRKIPVFTRRALWGNVQ